MSVCISTETVVDIDVTGFSFTPTAVLDVAIAIWIYTSGPERTAYTQSLFGSVSKLIKATPGANKVTVRFANHYSDTHYFYYRITCTAAKSG